MGDKPRKSQKDLAREFNESRPVGETKKAINRAGSETGKAADGSPILATTPAPEDLARKAQEALEAQRIAEEKAAEAARKRSEAAKRAAEAKKAAEAARKAAEEAKKKKEPKTP